MFCGPKTAFVSVPRETLAVKHSQDILLQVLGPVNKCEIFRLPPNVVKIDLEPWLKFLHFYTST